MSDVFEFRSAADGAVLRMSYADTGPESSLVVTAVGAGFEVAVPAYTYMCPSLPDFIREITEAIPNSVIQPWSTLEGEFTLNAKKDVLGHIFIVYRLRSPDIGSDKWWHFEGRLVLELGAMTRMQRDAQDFWRMMPPN